jgi:hypothetical protein
VWILMQQVNYWYMFCSCPILLNKWDYNEAVHQLFIDFKKTYDSVRRGVLYNSHWMWYPHETGKGNKNVSE